MLGQYWSCATARILTVYEGLKRAALNPVRYHLLPTKTLIAICQGPGGQATATNQESSGEDGDDE